MSHSPAYRQRYYKDRRERGLCIDCSSKTIVGKRWCQKHLDMRAEVLRRLRKKLRLEVFMAYGGARCACKECPEHSNPHLAFLTIDHINGGGTKHRVKVGGSRIPGGGISVVHFTIYRWLKKNGFPPGFRVLCWNCQWGVHINQGKCPHEEGASL